MLDESTLIFTLFTYTKCVVTESNTEVFEVFNILSFHTLNFYERFRSQAITSSIPIQDRFCFSVLESFSLSYNSWSIGKE